MIIEYDVHCFERTLQITFPKKYEGRDELKSEILEMLDDYYDEWHNSDQDTCLEEYMMDRLSETYAMWEEWESIPYGEDYEPRDTLWVCEHCLMGIESHEGNQATLAHGVDEMDAIDSRCGWCHKCGFDTLYELV
jgi:hypothetical protein